jgi:predicted dehydrogenase
MSRPINTCVLGVGLSGLTFHIPFILALPELFNLHSVLERNPLTPGGKVYERFGVQVTTFRSLDQVLADPTVELIVIGTPNETHYPFAKASLEAGKHGAISNVSLMWSANFCSVLVDKPVTATLVQAFELDALAQLNGLILYPFQNRRWDSDFMALKRLLALPDTSPHSLGSITEFESQ